MDNNKYKFAVKLPSKEVDNYGIYKQTLVNIVLDKYISNITCCKKVIVNQIPLENSPTTASWGCMWVLWEFIQIYPYSICKYYVGLIRLNFTGLESDSKQMAKVSEYNNSSSSLQELVAANEETQAEAT